MISPGITNNKPIGSFTADPRPRGLGSAADVQSAGLSFYLTFMKLVCKKCVLGKSALCASRRLFLTEIKGTAAAERICPRERGRKSLARGEKSLDRQGLTMV